MIIVDKLKIRILFKLNCKKSLLFEFDINGKKTQPLLIFFIYTIATEQALLTTDLYETYNMATA